MTNCDYPATHAVLDGVRGSGKRRTPAQWLAAIFEQQAAVLALTSENERMRDDLIHADDSIRAAAVALEVADTQIAALHRINEHTWVECPECESTSIRCHMCGFVSDGPAFLHEESNT